METRPYLLHALSPLHAGTGQAVDVIDLPIARMAATGIPIVPGSSVKGVLRDARQTSMETGKHFAVFGSPTNDEHANAGALSIGDARLLALPVRCFRGTFAWVTSPLLLHLAKRDLPGAPAVPTTGSAHTALVGAGSLNVYSANGKSTVYLQDLDLPSTTSNEVTGWAEHLVRWVSPEHPKMFTERFMVVADDTMAFLWETATQVDTRVRLDPETRTAAKGQLWTEESLPPETLLVGVFVADRSRRASSPMSPSEVLDAALGERTSLQFGGKATVGRGRCSIVPVR